VRVGRGGSRRAVRSLTCDQPALARGLGGEGPRGLHDPLLLPEGRVQLAEVQPRRRLRVPETADGGKRLMDSASELKNYSRVAPPPPGLGQEVPDALGPAAPLLQLLPARRLLGVRLHVALRDRDLTGAGQLRANHKVRGVSEGAGLRLGRNTTGRRSFPWYLLGSRSLGLFEQVVPLVSLFP